MHDALRLTGVVVVWKSLILLLTSLAPGPGYDTSTTLLPSTSKLTRWDAIYYVSKARRGDVFEQEWAFGKGLSTLLNPSAKHGIDTTIRAGIALSHLSHLIAVLLVWKIAMLLNTGHQNHYRFSKALPFVAGCLHVISPAGVFLSAPYAEAPFACLHMLGFWIYLKACLDMPQRGSVVRCGLIVLSGFIFGCSTILRSNGILSGLLFLVDAMHLARQICVMLSGGNFPDAKLLQLLATIVAGLCIAFGLFWPQYLAYEQYCSVEGSRPWCRQSLPLIYSFVQAHYWGVGFLRYWTISNIPLFLLAAPVLTAMLVSGYAATKSAIIRAPPSIPSLRLDRLALPQLILTVLAVTTYHVQIITRLSSGYPWLYIWVAQKLCKGSGYGKAAVAFSVMYALIQAGLYASFLPPA